MFGGKYKPKQLGVRSSREIAAQTGNCRISLEPVQVKPMFVTVFVYYGDSGAFNVLESPMLPSAGMSGPFAFFPSDEWVSVEEVPNGLRWEKRLLRPNEAGLRPPSAG